MSADTDHFIYIRDFRKSVKFGRGKTEYVPPDLSDLLCNNVVKIFKALAGEENSSRGQVRKTQGIKFFATDTLAVCFSLHRARSRNRNNRWVFEMVCVCVQEITLF